MPGYLHCMGFKSIWRIDRQVGRREANIRFEKGTNIKSYWSESFRGHVHSYTVWAIGPLFLYSFWWLCAPTSVSWRCRWGGVGVIVTHSQTDAARGACVCSPGVPPPWSGVVEPGPSAGVLDCWIGVKRRRLGGGGGGYGNRERKKVTRGIGRLYGFGEAFIFLPTDLKNMRIIVLFCGLRCCWQEMSDLYFIEHTVKAPSHRLWRLSMAVCMSAAKAGAML